MDCNLIPSTKHLDGLDLLTTIFSPFTSASTSPIKPDRLLLRLAEEQIQRGLESDHIVPSAIFSLTTWSGTTRPGPLRTHAAQARQLYAGREEPSDFPSAGFLDVHPRSVRGYQTVNLVNVSPTLSTCLKGIYHRKIHLRHQNRRAVQSSPCTEA